LGGYKIYPKKIEDVFNDLGCVQESAVFGVPHLDFGDSALAAVVLDNPALSLEDITAQAIPHLARFKRPRRYSIVETLPRNAMGNVQKNILRSDHSG